MFTTGMNFALGEDLEALRDMVHRFAQDRIAPMAAQIDETNQFPNELWKEFGELGLLGVTVSEEYGGANMGYLAHCIIVEEISRASASPIAPAARPCWPWWFRIKLHIALCAPTQPLHQGTHENPALK